ncbi:kinase-like domain-containing protein [Abortiporus biennis]|nr:kinase-like domain-containing protein [Abortiporus biennis]
MFADPFTQDSQQPLSSFWSHEYSKARREPSPNSFNKTGQQMNSAGFLGVSGTSDNTSHSPRLSPVITAASAPEPPLEAYLLASPISEATSLSQEDVSQSDLSMSPAAMFLSSFSPVVPPGKLPDDEGEIVAGYTLGPIIGYGGFSTIRKASSLQGGTVAIKIVRRSDIDKQSDPTRARQHVDYERQVWSSLSHEHVLPLFTSSHTPYADFFVTLYCPAGSLFDILKRDGRPALPQDDVGMMFRQVVRGLRYMHEVVGYVHGDLKLENVLVDEMGVCRIGDFGMARKIGEYDNDDVSAVAEVIASPQADEPRDQAFERTRSLRVPNTSARSRNRQASGIPVHLSMIKHFSGPRHRTSSPLPSSNEVPHVLPNPTYQQGSLPYAAPELLLPQSTIHYPRPNPAQDIWALGVMLYTLLTGRLPFNDAFEPRLQMKILHGVYDMPPGIGRGAESVLQGCLERNVSLRWSISMVDDVAWGIGWGEAGDDALPSPVRPTRPSPLRESAVMDDVDRSRSSSRPARSMTRSTSAVRNKSRSASRSSTHPYHHPHGVHHHQNAHSPHDVGHLASLSDSLLRSSSSSTFSSVSGLADVPLSPILRDELDDQAGNEGGRGRVHHSSVRRQSTLSTSRSRSPLEVPPTPTDTSLSERVRGRKPSPRHLGASPVRHPLLRRDELDTPFPSTDLDTVDEQSPSHASWGDIAEDLDAAPRGRYSRSSSCDSRVNASGMTTRHPLRRSQEIRLKDFRRESVPPPAIGLSWAKSEEECIGGASQVITSSQPRAIPSARSRSVGFDAVDRHYPPTRPHGI